MRGSRGTTGPWQLKTNSIDAQHKYRRAETLPMLQAIAQPTSYGIRLNRCRCGAGSLIFSSFGKITGRMQLGRSRLCCKASKLYQQAYYQLGFSSNSKMKETTNEREIRLQVLSDKMHTNICKHVLLEYALQTGCSTTFPERHMLQFY
jgi:hypothetical protein